MGERRRLRSIAAAFGLAMALPAVVMAQPAGGAKAEGDELLAQAGASDLFDNLTADGDDAIRLKHKASGLICTFNRGSSANRIVLFGSPVRGDDFACATGGEAGERTLYAVHAPGRTLAQAFDLDVADLKKSHPYAQPYELPKEVDSPALEALASPLMPPSRTARFIDEHKFTAVSSAVVKDWSLKFRFTCPEEHDEFCAGTAQPILWVTILAQMSGAPLDVVSPKQAV